MSLDDVVTLILVGLTIGYAAGAIAYLIVGSRR